MNAPDLLPCPFCGGKATHALTSKGWVVECEGRMGSCTMNARTHYQQTKYAAYDAWNRRDPAVILAAAMQLPEFKAMVEAVDAEINARQAYEAVLERGGSYKRCARVRAEWHLAIAEMMRARAALAALKPDATTRKRKPRQPEPTPRGRPAPFTSAELEARMDAICGCSGQHDCDCVSVYNRATAELWTEKNTLKPDAKG
jgi:Lar family restriction alleviation protein